MPRRRICKRQGSREIVVIDARCRFAVSCLLCSVCLKAHGTIGVVMARVMSGNYVFSAPVLSYSINSDDRFPSHHLRSDRDGASFDQRSESCVCGVGRTPAAPRDTNLRARRRPRIAWHHVHVSICLRHRSQLRSTPYYSNTTCSQDYHNINNRNQNQTTASYQE